MVFIPQASAGLQRYTALAEPNLIYDASAKAYVAGPEFKPRLLKPSARRYLAYLRGMADDVFHRGETWIGRVLEFGVVPLVRRRLDAGRLRKIIQTIRTKASLHIRCGACGGSVILVGKAYYGCANYKNRGTCTNRLSMRMDVLERTVLAGLKDRLLKPDLVAEFVREFQQAFNRQQADQGQRRHQLQAGIDKVERQIVAIVAAVKDGLYHAAMKDELTRLEERRTTLTQELSAQPAPAPAIHPNLAEFYRRKVESLRSTANSPPSWRSQTKRPPRVGETGVRRCWLRGPATTYPDHAYTGTDQGLLSWNVRS